MTPRRPATFVNCWWFKHPTSQSDGLAELMALMITLSEPRDPGLYQGRPELAEIMARRSDLAAGASMYANQAMQIAVNVERGAMPPPNSSLTSAQAAQQLTRMACEQYEAAVALCCYDNDQVAFNLVSCCAQDHLRPPEGARSQLFAAV